MKYLILLVSINPKLERDRYTTEIEKEKWQRERRGSELYIMVYQIKEQL